jgi:SAM-dependent methyltransferase
MEIHFRSLRAALKLVPGLRESSHVLRAAGSVAGDALHRSLTGRTYAAARLERAFNQRADPWNFSGSLEEQTRFEKTWELVPGASYGRILEVGCAEGHFTDQIAGRFPDAAVVAVDLVALALERARVRCSRHANVRFRCQDVAREPIHGTFDLIFCMGVLEYGPPLSELDMVRRSLVDALNPGGYLLLETHAVPADLERRWWARRLMWGARAHHDRLQDRGLVRVDEAYVCGDARLTTVLRKMA